MDEWTVNLDFYASRGPAVGTTLSYETGTAPYPLHSGRLRAYYVSDTGDTDATGLQVPQHNRGRFHERHRSQLSRGWRVDAEFYWLSDAGFLNEYLEADFEEEKTPESYLLARYLRNSTYLALLYKGQVNDFLTQVEETPTVDLEILSLPLGRLLYEGSVVAGIYDLEFSDQLTPPPADPPSLSRLHTEHTLSLPFTAGIFRINPFVRALATWAGESAAVAGSFGDSESRTGLGGGFSISTTFARTFGLSSELFDLNRLRHVLIPHLEVEALSVSGADSADFIQMDAVDAIDSGTEITLGLRQRLQTKRRRDGGQWRSVNWAEL
ncbi:MAG: LPS assembly protein LptD, partial [Planctomycetota bacterium]